MENVPNNCGGDTNPGEEENVSQMYHKGLPRRGACLHEACCDFLEMRRCQKVQLQNNKPSTCGTNNPPTYS